MLLPIDVASFVDCDGKLANYEGEPEKVVFDVLPEVCHSSS